MADVLAKWHEPTNHELAWAVKVLVVRKAVNRRGQTLHRSVKPGAALGLSLVKQGQTWSNRPQSNLACNGQSWGSKPAAEKTQGVALVKQGDRLVKHGFMQAESNTVNALRGWQCEAAHQRDTKCGEDRSSWCCCGSQSSLCSSCLEASQDRPHIQLKRQRLLFRPPPLRRRHRHSPRHRRPGSSSGGALCTSLRPVHRYPRSCCCCSRRQARCLSHDCWLSHPC